MCENCLSYYEILVSGRKTEMFMIQHLSERQFLNKNRSMEKS